MKESRAKAERANVSISKKRQQLLGAAVRAAYDAGLTGDDAAMGEFIERFQANLSGALEERPLSPVEQAQLLTGAFNQVLSANRLPGVALLKRMSKRLTIELRSTGRRTNVTVRPEIYDQLVAFNGSESAAHRLVEDLANEAPADVDNRSKWIERRFLAIQAAAAGQHSGASTH